MSPDTRERQGCAGACPSCGFLPSANRCLLWVDLRRDRHAPSPFHEIFPADEGRLVVGCEGVHATIEALQPEFLVFEFDAPDQDRLDAMEDARQSFPELPIMVLSEGHSDLLATWALHTRAWDYLVAPLPTTEIAIRLETLCVVARHERGDFALRDPNEPCRCRDFPLAV